MSLPNPIQYHVYANGSRPPDPTFYSYVLCRQGLVKWAKNRHFEASILIAPATVAGLGTWACGVILNVPRIPPTWLQSIFRHALLAGENDVRVTHLPVEQMYHLHWLNESWQVSVPNQVGTTGRVSYRGGDEQSIVLDLHSHHQMAADFSPIDNRDEQGLRFYAVIGRIYDRPEIRLRLGVWGDFVELPLTTLFQGAGPFIDRYGDRS